MPALSCGWHAVRTVRVAQPTPDENGLPAGLTFAQFRETLRTGVDQDDPSRLLQVMPWPVYGNLSDRDLLAIYTYLRTIPSLPDTTAP
jgi:hypothetical protein